MKDDEFKALYENYKHSKFMQQKMNGWRPIPTISCITIIFVFFGVFFILIGMIILIVISQLHKIDIIYEKECICNDEECFFTQKIEKNMKQPIMLYYQIDDFEQNNRAYIDNKKNEKIFDDKFGVWKVNGADISKSVNILDDYSENWLKINPYHNPRKYLGNITRELNADSILNVTFKLGENFRNKVKHLIITEKSVFGGRGFFLGSAYIVFGFLCLVASIIFINAYNKFHKKI